MNQLKRLALLSLLLAPTACGDSESAAVGDFIDGLDGYARNICECDYDNGLLLLFAGKSAYESKEACDADLPPSSAERGCVSGLFQDAETDYTAVLDCRSDAYARLNTCLGSKTCTDTARGDCLKTLADEIEDCPDLPESVEAQLTDCLNN